MCLWLQFASEVVAVREHVARNATDCDTIEIAFLHHSVVVVPTGSGREANNTL
jgi:predicted nuclease of predicted toxin-antitoxin system